MTTKSEREHIIAISVKNYMGVEVGECRPEPSGLVLVGGKNGAAKTSFLNSVKAAIGGNRLVAQKPIREGEEEATNVIELDNYDLHWSVKGERTTKLTLYSKADGHEVKKARTVLAGIFGPNAFDPLEFTRLKPPKQRETLIDLKPELREYLQELEDRRAVAFETRTNVNRDAKRLEGTLKTLRKEPFYAKISKIPDEPVAAQDIADRIKAAEAKNRERKDQAEAIEKAETAAVDSATKIREKLQEIEELKKEIEALAEHESSQQEEARKLTNDLPEHIDTSGLIGDFDKITEINEEVRQKAKYAETDTEWRATTRRADTLTLQIEEVDGQKHDAVKAANFPVPGLDFSDDGVLYEGHPFEQASTTEQIIVSFAIGAALNPKAGFMIVYEATLMDPEHLMQLHDLAVKADIQVLAEYVTKSEEDAKRCAIHFVDGIGTAKEG